MKNNENNLFEERDYYINLYEFYGSLLTTKQINYFQMFYYSDLTLSEIAQNNNISRSAVFDAICKINKILENYEKSLKLFEKQNKLNDLLDKYIDKSGDYNILINKIKEIE